MAPNAEARPPAPPSAAQPQRLGKYRIEQKLGAGGMGTVFLAVDTELQRTVALKVLSRENAANPQLVRRFKSEGQAAARLEHDNIVKVFEAGQIDGQLYLALEYVDGIDVLELIRKRGVLPVRRSIEIVRQVAVALDHAWERSIVHRDIKPSNFLIRRDGVVKLADMGLARALDETQEGGITRAGMTVGTVDYISPEQGADSKLADIRSDLYSLGCSWYHMLTGEVPYPEGATLDKLRAHASAPIPDPRRINDRVPAPVVAVLHRLMAKLPEDRYQTPAELLQELSHPNLLRQELGSSILASLAEAESSDDDEPPTDLSIPRLPDPASARDAVSEQLTERSEIPARAPDPRTVPADKRQSRKQKQGERKAQARVTGAKAQSGRRTPAASPPNGESRPLPPRAARPERFAVSQRSVDPDHIKYGVFGVLGLTVVAAVGWGVYHFAESDIPPPPTGMNPLASAIADPVETAQVPPTHPEPSDPNEPTQPAASLTDFRPQSPFPGVEEARTNPEIEDVPRWVYEERDRSLPESAPIVVDPDAAEAASPRTLADALPLLPDDGGVIELRGRGPHPIDGIEVEPGTNLTIRSSREDQAVVVFGETAGPIRVRQARLELDGLHVVAAGRGRGADRPLLELESATAVVRNGSFTLADPADGPVPAIRLRGPAAEPSRCVVENMIFRGNDLTACMIDGRAHELIAGNCLMASSRAPALAILSGSTVSEAPESAPAVVQVLASAILARSTALHFGQTDPEVVPGVRVRLRDTTLAGGGDGPTVQFENWSESPASELDRPRALGVELSLERTCWFNWPQLTRFQSATGEERLVGDEAAWLQFWRTPLTAPVGRIEITESDLNPLRVTPSSAASVLRNIPAPSESESETAFFRESELPALPETLVARVVAEFSRPRIPDEFQSAISGPVVRIDLSKKGLRLNEELNSEQCPDGAHVILTGRQRALIEPVVLRGKSLRLEFSGEEGPLVIEPVARAGSSRPDALFSIEQGQLELVGGFVRIPSSETTAYPVRVLRVVDGSFVVRRCVLLGQFGAGAQDVPAVEWTGESEAVRFGLIEDSFISSPHCALDAKLAGRILELRNSIVFSPGSALRLLPGEAESVLHLHGCTLSAGEAFFRIAPSAVPEHTGRLQVFVKNSVYGPPAGDQAVLLLQEGDGGAPLDWWETMTAVSDRITRFRTGADSDSQAQNFERDWVGSWGADHVQYSLAGPVAVIPAAPLPEPAKVRPLDFRLAESSAAAAVEGGPLGVRVDAVGPQASSTRETQPAPAGPQRRRSQPDF